MRAALIAIAIAAIAAPAIASADEAADRRAFDAMFDAVDETGYDVESHLTRDPDRGTWRYLRLYYRGGVLIGAVESRAAGRQATLGRLANTWGRVAHGDQTTAEKLIESAARTDTARVTARTRYRRGALEVKLELPGRSGPRVQAFEIRAPSLLVATAAAIARVEDSRGDRVTQLAAPPPALENTPDALFDRAAERERAAAGYARDGAALRSVAGAYRYYLDRAPPDHPRRSEAKRRLGRLDGLIADLAAPDRIESDPPWPYGRPGFNLVNVGFSFVVGLSSADAVGRLWQDQTGAPAEDASWSHFGAAISADVRVQPSWMLGLLFSIAQIDAEAGADKLVANMTSIVATARHELAASTEGGEWAAAYLELGGGVLLRDANLIRGASVSEFGGDATAVAMAGLGIELNRGRYFTLGLFSRVWISGPGALTSNDTPITVGGEPVETSNVSWEILGFRFGLSK